MGQTDSTVKKLSIIFVLMGDKELSPKGSTKWWRTYIERLVLVYYKICSLGFNLLVA